MSRYRRLITFQLRKQSYNGISAKNITCLHALKIDCCKWYPTHIVMYIWSLFWGRNTEKPQYIYSKRLVHLESFIKCCDYIFGELLQVQVEQLRTPRKTATLSMDGWKFSVQKQAPENEQITGLDTKYIFIREKRLTIVSEYKYYTTNHFNNLTDKPAK